MRISRRSRAPRIVVPPPGVLRRERKALVESREGLVRDLGGLIFEMYKRDRFNEELVRERCSELLALDRRLEEVEQLLDMATRRAPVWRCTCGAELPPFSRFCPQCGRPTEPAADGAAPG